MTMLMGCSRSTNDHGGTEDWDGWRCYTESSMLSLANRTGSTRPVFLAYSKGGSNLGGTSPNYTTVYNEVLADLNSFYYTTTTGQTHTARWGIQLYWSNGNENHDKGALATPHTPTGIANYVISQHALYDAVHYIDPTTGSRRFPDAFAGSNPTHNAEQSELVEDWLHPSAQYHDFVMWSMYPPGRSSTTDDPTYNWPSFVDADYDNNPQGFLIRCFRRTKLAEAAGGHALMIGCGEVGIGDDPDDNTTRPYYAVHGLAWSMEKLAIQYDLAMPFACWWDNQVDTTAPQNILSDEDPATSPSTREAWQNWPTYNHLNGGTHPASWTGNPKSGWKTSGTHPTGITVTTASRSGTAALSLSATGVPGVGSASRSGTASLSLSATGIVVETTAARSGTASLTLAGSAQPSLSRTGSALLSVVAGGFATQDFLGSITGSGSYYQRMMARSPVAYWRFGGNLNDHVGGHNGEVAKTYVTPATTNTVTYGYGLLHGDPNPALTLEPEVSVTVPWGPWMDTAAFTFEGLFEITSTLTAPGAVMARSSVNDPHGWGLLLNGLDLTLMSGTDGPHVTLSYGEYHFAVTGGEGSIQLYLNGELALVSSFDSEYNTGSEFNFGAPLPGYSFEGFPGRLDEFIYLDFKLSALDVYEDWQIWGLGQDGAIDMVVENAGARELIPSYAGAGQSYRDLMVSHAAWAYWAHSPAFVSLAVLGLDYGSRGHDATVTGSANVWEPKIGPTQSGPESPNVFQNPASLVSQDDFTSSSCTLSAWVAISPKAGAIATEIPLVCMAPSAGASTFDKCLYLDTSGRLNWQTGTGGSVEVITDPTALPQDGVARHVAVSVGPAGTKIRVSGTTVATGANTTSYASAQKIFYFNGGTGGGHDFTVSGSASRTCWVQATIFDEQLSDTQTDEHWTVGRSTRNIEYFWGLTAAEVLFYGSHATDRSGRTDHFTTSSGILASDPQLKSLAPTASMQSSILNGSWGTITELRPNREIRHVYWQPSGLSGTQVICGLITWTNQFTTSPSSTTTVTPKWRVASVGGSLTFIGMSTTSTLTVQDTFTHTTPIVDGAVNALGFELTGTAVDLWVNGVKNSFTRTQSTGWTTVSSGNTVSSYEFAGTITPSPLPTSSINVMTGLVSEFLYNGASTPVGYQGGGAEYNKPERFFEDLALRASELRITFDRVNEVESVFELIVSPAVVTQALTLDMVAETDTTGAFDQTPRIETLVETGEALGVLLPEYTGEVVAQGAGEITLVDEAVDFFSAELRLQILESTILRAPTSITVTLSGGVPQQDVVFAIDGTTVYTVSLDAEGGLGPTSVNLSAALGTVGDHVLSVTQTTDDGVTADSETFTVLYAPTPDPQVPGPDTPPVDVPGAVAWENNVQVRHWVFQDLLPEIDGGIGSYVLPHNPPHMSSPHYEYAMSSLHTTAHDGKIHVFQASNTPKEWTFTGYCSTAEQQAKMLEYRYLNRRFWVIDHRNRAWVVVLTDAQFVPRLRQNYNGVNTDWGSDYTITAVVLDQDYQTPEEA